MKPLMLMLFALGPFDPNPAVAVRWNWRTLMGGLWYGQRGRY